MMNISKAIKPFVVLTIAFLALAIFLNGCKKKEEQPQPEQPKVEQTQPKAEEPPKVEEPKVEVASIKGTWKGTFYNRTMTLFIGEQTEMAFDGETTVNWAKPLTMKVKGTFDPKALTMKFADQSSTKDAGTYEGTLTSDLKTFTGKFTLNSGGKKFDVKLSLQ